MIILCHEHHHPFVLFEPKCHNNHHTFVLCEPKWEKWKREPHFRLFTITLAQKSFLLKMAMEKFSLTLKLHEGSSMGLFTALWLKWICSQRCNLNVFVHSDQLKEFKWGSLVLLRQSAKSGAGSQEWKKESGIRCLKRSKWIYIVKHF